MKNVSICILLLCSISVFAQQPSHEKMDEQNSRMERMKTFTPEQQAELKSRQLTLSLDLTENQQQAVKKLSLEKTAKQKAPRLDRESKKKLTSDELYQLQLSKLNAQITFKAGMKSILNKEQFTKWEQLHMERRKHRSISRRGQRLGEHPKKR